MQKDFKELLEKLDKLLNGNPNDILLITNPDLNCDDIDTVEGWSHQDYFEVKWDKRPHRIIPGQTRRMPRWLALHFAKHLADHILIKEMDKTGKAGLLNSPVRRPQVLSQILLGIDEYFEEPEAQTIGQTVEKEVEDLNTPVNSYAQTFGGGRSMELGETNAGTISNSVLGNLKPSSSDSDLKDVIKEAGKDWKSDKAKPSKSELLVECGKLGIEVSGKEKVDDLLAKIAAF